MDIDEATQILKRQSGDMHEWAAAGAYVVSHHNARQTAQSTFTRDAAPRIARSSGGRGEQHVYIHLPTHDTEGAQVEEGEGGTTGAQHAKGKVGGVLRQRLSGNVGDWYVALTPDGGVGLYQHASSDGLLDPGRTSLTGDQVRQLRAVDSSRSHNTLAEINRRNRAAWEHR